jgi:hypothetical protein
MNIFINSIFKKFYIPLLGQYSFLKSNGVQIFDIKCQILKQVLQLGSNQYLNEKSTEVIKQLDIVELILFFIWFNSSLGKKYEHIPKIFISERDFLMEKQEIIKVSFKKGNWWYIKNDINNSSLNLISLFNELGENLIITYDLI